MYPVAFFDAREGREDAVVRNKVICLALGVLPDGISDISGLWIENTEGTKFRLKVFNDLKTLDCNDILIAVTDGLKEMAEVLGAVYPATTLQTCIVHLIRNSLDFANWKERTRWRRPSCQFTRQPSRSLHFRRQCGALR